MVRTGARTAVLVALCGAAACSAPAAAQQSYPDPAGYCDPANTQYDPDDTARDAPPIVLPPGFSRDRRRLGGSFTTPVIEGGARDSREAIVFVHGNPGSSLDWLGLLRAAPAGARVVAADLLGFGEADKPYDFPYSLEASTPLFNRALDELGIDRAHLVVHDLGGVVALEAAIARPSRLASAVLINSGVLIGYTDHKYAQRWKQPVQGEATMQATTREVFVNSIQNDAPRPMPREFLDRNYDYYDRPMRCAVLKAYRSATDVSAIGERQAAALRPLDRPALVIWGDSDPYVPADIAPRQRQAFPRAAVHLIENSGHWPFVDEEQRVVELMRGFLGGRVRERAGAQLRVAVAPRTARRGARTVFRVTATLRGNQPVAGAVVRIGTRRAVTGSDGRAVLALGPGRRGLLGVSARKPGLRKGVAAVRVVSR